MIQVSGSGWAVGIFPIAERIIMVMIAIMINPISPIKILSV